MAISAKDIKEVTANLPHPKKWEFQKMDAAHACEDGKWRIFTFEFECIEVRELEDPIKDFREILEQELNAGG